MRKSMFIAAVVATGTALAGISPSFAASAANSQNGTDSSNPNATLSAPTSTSAVPATTMPMGSTTGTTSMQGGSNMNSNAIGTNGAMDNGAETTMTPKP